MNEVPSSCPFGAQPPETVFLLLDPHAGPNHREATLAWIESVLPALNWRFHVYMMHIDQTSISGETFAELADPIIRYLREQRLASLYLHPVLSARILATDLARWNESLELLEQFLKEAHDEQSEIRLAIAPILTAGAELPASQVRTVAEFFADRLAPPSLYLGANATRSSLLGIERVARFYLDPDGGLPVEGIIGQLWVNHVFESVLERVDSEENQIRPCSPHLVVDERNEGVFPCFARWAKESPSAFLAEKLARDEVLSHTVPPDHCAGCIGESLLAMKENLSPNDSETEGRRALSKLSLDLAALGEQRLAAPMARRAFELSKDDEARSAALIHEGLCRLDLGELEQAEAALELATKYSSDPGFVAYQRGRVQFAWRDYIEALDRFEEALETVSPHVPEADICFEAALCHINLEEYPEARPYLDRTDAEGTRAATVSFYRGVCDFGEGKFEVAKARFEEALRIGPAREDLGRVFFYVGSCLKELEQFDDAIDVLKAAVEADPNDIANQNLLGFCYYKIKKHEEAVVCFRRAVEIDPTSGIDWANLASNLRDLGRIDDAILLYKKALSLDPTLGFAATNLAKLSQTSSDDGIGPD